MSRQVVLHCLSLPTMITISHKNLCLNMRHHCSRITVHPTRPLLNADFLVAASELVWPDINPDDTADSEDDEDEDEQPDSQVTHLTVEGDFNNYENNCPLGLLTRPLPSLHTVKLSSVTLKSIHHLEYFLNDLKRLSIWDCHVSTQGLFLLLRSMTSLTHFAFGGKRAQVVEDLDNPQTQPIIVPPSFPPTLQFLHLNICTLINWQDSPVENLLRPRIISWLSQLHGWLSLTTFECKMFTNDVRLARKIISLAEDTLQNLSMVFLGTLSVQLLNTADIIASIASETHVGSAFIYLGYLQKLW